MAVGQQDRAALDERVILVGVLIQDGGDGVKALLEGAKASAVVIRHDLVGRAFIIGSGMGDHVRLLAITLGCAATIVAGCAGALPRASTARHRAEGARS